MSDEIKKTKKTKKTKKLKIVINKIIIYSILEY
jgi:hypothetical protein